MLLPHAAGLDIDDDRVVEVDQIVGSVSEEGVPFQGSSPLCRWIRARDELRLRFAGRAPGGFIQRVEILAHRPAGPSEIVSVDCLRSLGRALLVGVGPDQASIDGEAFCSGSTADVLKGPRIIGGAICMRDTFVL